MNKKGFVLWFTGLSGAGKSTLAEGVYQALKDNGNNIERFDGDIFRKNLSKDLGFSREDREENIRRIGFVVNLLSRNQVAVVASFISPYRKQRQELRSSINNFIEVFVNTPLEVCEQRDPKGLYKKARQKQIPYFTGISDPYEAPESPDLELRAGELGVEECLAQIIDFLIENDYIRKF